MQDRNCSDENLSWSRKGSEERIRRCDRHMTWAEVKLAHQIIMGPLSAALNHRSVTGRHPHIYDRIAGSRRVINKSGSAYTTVAHSVLVAHLH